MKPVLNNRDRPKINSSTVDIENFKSYPEGTLGKEYSKFLQVNVSLMI